MKRIKIVGLCLTAVFAFSAITAGAAQAVVGGPIWIEKGKTELKGTKIIETVTGISAVQKLKSTAVTIECPTLSIKAGATNTINSGNPGTDFATLVFAGCHVAGKTLAECAVTSVNPLKATNVGEIWVAVRTLLGYEKGKTEKTPIYDQFFPNPGPTLFVELEFTGTNCSALNKTKIAVNATGTENKSFKSKCGVIAEVGKVKAKVFEAAVSGELAKVGGLRLPESAITEEEVWNSATSKFEVVKCTLEAAASKATQIGEASIELEKGEEFGVEI